MFFGEIASTKNDFPSRMSKSQSLSLPLYDGRNVAQIMKEHVFNMKDPIIVGMEVMEGNLRVGTPLCIPAKDGLEIGRVTSIEQVRWRKSRLAMLSKYSSIGKVVRDGWHD